MLALINQCSHSASQHIRSVAASRSCSHHRKGSCQRSDMRAAATATATYPPSTPRSAGTSGTMQLEAGPTRKKPQPDTSTSSKHLPQHIHGKETSQNASHPPVPDTISKPPPVAQGRVELIVGPMFAGKSTMLLKLVRQNQSNGTRVLLVKPAVDTRYTAGMVSTHTGDSLPCKTVTSLGSLRASLDEGSAWESISTIAIDEAQFFPDLVDFVVEAADLHHKTVLVAGLDSDFQRKRFGQVHDLLQHADSITKLAARCVECKAPAIYTRRTACEHQEQQLIGGSDVYSPVCRQHYVASGARVVEIVAAASCSTGAACKQ